MIRYELTREDFERNMTRRGDPHSSGGGAR